MNTVDDKQNNGAELSFFSTITTSVTHEMVNVCAIIRELAGLMEDLLYDSEDTEQIDVGKFKSIAQKIGSQTDRGERITKRLNRFAHSLDEPVCVVNLTAMLQDFTALCKRYTDLKNIDIYTTFPEQSMDIRCNPFLLQLVLFQCFELSLKNGNESGAIKLTYSVQQGTTEILINAPTCATDAAIESTMAMIDHIVRNTNLKFSLEVIADNILQYTIRLASD
jgi:signal transduction histidine kinase